MKIDFQGNYTSIQRLIGARATAAYRATEAVNQKIGQPTEIKANLAPSSTATEAVKLPPPPSLLGLSLQGENQSSAVNPQQGMGAGSVNSLTNSERGSLSSSSRLIDGRTIDGRPPVPTILSVDKLAVEAVNGIASDRAVQGTPFTERPATQPLAQNVSFNPAARSELAGLIKRTGVGQGVDPLLSLAVATAESSLNPQAVSGDGHNSKGLFQLLDRTGNQLHAELGGSSATYDPFHPEQNVNLGVRYLRKLHEFFSAPTEITGVGTTVAAANSASLEKLAVAAFNAGEGRVTSAQLRAGRSGFDPSRYEHVERFLPESTQTYVSRVMKFKREFGASGRTGSEIS